MKTKIKVISNVLFLLVFILHVSCKKQEAEWKGTTTVEKDGVTIVKNSKEPMYGELTFELEEDLSIGKEDDENYMFHSIIMLFVDSQGNILVLDAGNNRIQKFDTHGNYLQTIGREGQGPGEFDFPTIIYLDSKDNIYVFARRKIHLFDRNGKFLKAIPISKSIRNFGVTKEGNFLALTSSGSMKGKEVVFVRCIDLLSPERKIIKTITSFSERVMMLSPSPEPPPTDLGRRYASNLFFSPINEELGVYGYSSEYKLFFINFSGEIVYIIEKDEQPESITKKEKRRIIDDFKKVAEKAGQVRKYTAKFPKYKPFFNRILKDNKDRIYIKKFEQTEGSFYDLFSKEGYYLYKIEMAHNAQIIKNGYIYLAERDRDTGYSKIKRYQIKNWDQIKN